MKHCDNCGTKLSGGTCPNCAEELYIYENQIDDLPENLSEEFMNKVRQQKEEKLAQK